MSSLLFIFFFDLQKKKNSQRLRVAAVAGKRDKVIKGRGERRIMDLLRDVQEQDILGVGGVKEVMNHVTEPECVHKGTAALDGFGVRDDSSKTKTECGKRGGATAADKMGG